MSEQNTTGADGQEPEPTILDYKEAIRSVRSRNGRITELERVLKQALEALETDQWQKKLQASIDIGKVLPFSTENVKPGQTLSDEQIINAMREDGCERIENFYNVGPVQKAAVWSFAHAIVRVQSTGTVREGAVLLTNTEAPK